MYCVIYHKDLWKVDAYNTALTTDLCLQCTSSLFFQALDYEQNNKLKLEIMARNEAELSGTSAQWLSIPVDLTVINVDEGPQFTAPTVRFSVKENVPNGTVIGTYTAIDPETKSSNGIM